MAWPKWRHTLNESKRLAVKAIDEYNCSTGHYGDFIATMVRAWLYLLQAEFQKDKVDNIYRASNGSSILVDGEPKQWDVLESAKRRFPASNDPVRRNLELFIALRNKVEHRYEHALKSALGGRAHALVINYEREVVDCFGVEHSLADQLRFPLFVASITAPAKKTTIAATRALTAARTLLARFDADLGADVLDDQRYDFRVRLVPIIGPKSDADAAYSFVKLDELTDEQRKVMVEAGRAGNVVTKVKTVSVDGHGQMLPKHVVAAVQTRVPYLFTLDSHQRMWRHFKVRPGSSATNKADTIEAYCVWHEPTHQYLYTQAWIDKIVAAVPTADKYTQLLGRPPKKSNVTPIDSARAAKEPAEKSTAGPRVS